MQIHFHTEGSNTIFQFIPQDVLPVEFGGKGGSLHEIKGDYHDYKIIIYLFNNDKTSRPTDFLIFLLEN